VTIDEVLLTEARRRGISISRFLDAALRDYLRGAEQEQWHQENKSAIAAYNRRIESEGTFGEHYRSF